MCIRDRISDRLEKLGWKVTRLPQAVTVPEIISSRYPSMAGGPVVKEICSLADCAHPSKQFWLLTARDFLGHPGSAFAWNEWEMLSLSAAVPEDQPVITKFWDRHLPLFLGVDPYRYIAVATDSGHLVAGSEPEFEEATTVARSIEGLLERIDAGLDLATL